MRSLNETTQLIRDVHKRLRGLLRQLDGLDLRGLELYRAVILELCLEAQVYIELEERVLFPRLHDLIKERAGGGETPASEYIHQSFSEHREIVGLIRAIRPELGQSAGNLRREVGENLEELRSILEGHMYADERELLPLMEWYFPTLDAELSMKWFDTSDEIRARIGATNPSQPSHAQNPHGGEQKRKAS